MRRLIVFMVLPVLAAACAGPATPDPNQVSQLVQQAVQATLAAQPSATPVPTATVFPPTSVSPAATEKQATATPAQARTATLAPANTLAPTSTATTLPASTPTSGPSALANTVVNLRAGPGTHYPVIGATKQGQTYGVQGRTEDGSWLEICCVDQRTAWVAASVVGTAGDMGSVAVAKISQLLRPRPLQHQHRSLHLPAQSAAGTTASSACPAGQATY